MNKNIKSLGFSLLYLHTSLSWAAVAEMPLSGKQERISVCGSEHCSYDVEIQKKISDSILALSHVLHKWSGKHSFRNISVALYEATKSTQSTQPVIDTALHSVGLAIKLREPVLFRENIAILRSLDQKLAKSIIESSDLSWLPSNYNLTQSTYEMLSQGLSRKKIFGRQLFGLQNEYNLNFSDEAENNLSGQENFDNDGSRVSLDSEEAFVADALYGSFENQNGAAKFYKLSPGVQKFIDKRSSLFRGRPKNCGLDYYDNITARANKEAVTYASVGAAAGAVVGSFVGPIGGFGTGVTVGGAGGAIGFIGGAIVEAVVKYDEYTDCKTSNTKLESDNKQEAEAKAEKDKATKDKTEKAEAEEWDAILAEEEKQSQEEEEEKNKRNRTADVSPHAQDSDTGGQSADSIYRIMKLNFLRIINVNNRTEGSGANSNIRSKWPSYTDPTRHDAEGKKINSIVKDSNNANVTDTVNPKYLLKKNRGN